MFTEVASFNTSIDVILIAVMGAIREKNPDLALEIRNNLVESRNLDLHEALDHEMVRARLDVLIDALTGTSYPSE